MRPLDYLTPAQNPYEMNALLCRGCLFKSKPTGHGCASSVGHHSRLYQMSYCWNVRDVVIEIGEGEVWCECRSFPGLDLLFHDNRAHRGAFPSAGWKSPSPIPETSKVGQAGQGWQQSTTAAAAVPVPAVMCLVCTWQSLCICTHSHI